MSLIVFTMSFVWTEEPDYCCEYNLPVCVFQSSLPVLTLVVVILWTEQPSATLITSNPSFLRLIKKKKIKMSRSFIFWLQYFGWKRAGEQLFRHTRRGRLCLCGCYTERFSFFFCTRACVWLYLPAASRWSFHVCWQLAKPSGTCLPWDSGSLLAEIGNNNLEITLTESETMNLLLWCAALIYMT